MVSLVSFAPVFFCGVLFGAVFCSLASWAQIRGNAAGNIPINSAIAITQQVLLIMSFLSELIALATSTVERNPGRFLQNFLVSSAASVVVLNAVCLILRFQIGTAKIGRASCRERV